MTDGSGYLWWAVGLGAVSAVSLPLGSLAGLVFRPGPRSTGAMAAFGAGALVAAVAVELVAPAAAAVVDATGHAEHARSALTTLLAGAIAGGLIFLAMDAAINARGGFLRKTSTLMDHLRRRRTEAHRRMLEDLCTIPVLRLLPPDRVALLVEDVHAQAFTSGEKLFSEGDSADAMYFVRKGEVTLSRDGLVVDTAKPGQTVGETALLGDSDRVVTATARQDVKVLAISSADFARWRRACPELDRALMEIAAERLERVGARGAEEAEAARAWAMDATRALRVGAEIPTPAELRSARDEQEGAGLAIWLGGLIDGMPESLVIGSGFVALLASKLAVSDTVTFFDVIPYTLLAGLFLSNVPEALSSSVSMATQGWRPRTILSLWFSQLVVISVGAGVGYLLGDTLSHGTIVAIEGLAAGAMLTVVASTMIPEAVHLAGNAVAGGATLLGFVSAVFFKLLE